LPSPTPVTSGEPQRVDFADSRMISFAPWQQRGKTKSSVSQNPCFLVLLSVPSGI
jgi:hypothetical protein